MTDLFDDTKCGHCGHENLTDYPVCSTCAKVLHFPYQKRCIHCHTVHAPTLRLFQEWVNNRGADDSLITQFAAERNIDLAGK